MQMALKILNSEFILILAYMVDIFDHLNQQMQRSRVNIVKAEEKPEGFFKKSYRYENDEHRMITLQTFSCWMTV